MKIKSCNIETHTYIQSTKLRQISQWKENTCRCDYTKYSKSIRKIVTPHCTAKEHEPTNEIKKSGQETQENAFKLTDNQI